MFILGKEKLFSAFMFWGHVSLKLKRMKFYSSLSYHFLPPPIISGSSRLRGNYESEESAYLEHKKFPIFTFMASKGKMWNKDECSMKMSHLHECLNISST